MGFYCLVPVTVLAMATFVGVAPLSAQGTPESKINWIHSANTAVSLARQFDQPILVYVTSENCGFCRKTEQEVWSNPDIIALVEDGFVPLRLHAERDAELVASLQIRAFPTTLIFSSDARPVQRVTGYQRPVRFAAILRGHPQAQATEVKPAPAEIPAQNRIQWQHSVEAATARAQRSKLPILVYVTSNDCGYCRKMENEVWGNADVIAMVETGFIPLELNAERDSDLVRSLNVRGFPTTIVFSPDAQFVTSRTGYMPSDQLAELLRGSQQSLLASQQVTQNP